MDDLEEMRPGVLNQDQILSLKGDVIDRLENDDVDLSAFDLHLSQQGWEMNASVKASKDTSVNKIIRENSKSGLPNGGPWTLETGRTYIFALKEYLRFPEGSRLFGQATGKSSIGRLDVLTRLMVDNCSSFDTIEDDCYKGSLYLEVTPITFPIQVKEGDALSQLRLFRGRPHLSELKDEVLPLYGPMILNEQGKAKEEDERRELTVNLSPDDNGICAFITKEKGKTKDNNLPVDVTKGDGSHDPKDYWTGVGPMDGTLGIEPERFYILRSRERFRLPPDVAVYCQAISETLGELRIHYAGFVHPGFGRDRKEGTPVIFEVRGHNVKVLLQHGETLAHIKFYRMSKPCAESCIKAKKSGYEGQELKLSKYFREWPK